MTDAQIALLKRLIEADRTYHSKKAEGRPVSRDERGVEVGQINGVDRRTANALIDAGLAECVALHHGNGYLFLGKYEPYDALDATS